MEPLLILFLLIQIINHCEIDCKILNLWFQNIYIYIYIYIYPLSASHNEQKKKDPNGRFGLLLHGRLIASSPVKLFSYIF
jgi:hypothetical protein